MLRATHKVPWNDLADDTDRLAESIGELLRGGANGLAHDFVSPAGIVPEAVGDLAEVIIQGDGVRLA